MSYKRVCVHSKGVAVLVKVTILMSKMPRNPGLYQRYAEVLKFWDFAKKSVSCVIQTTAATLTMRPKVRSYSRKKEKWQMLIK